MSSVTEAMSMSFFYSLVSNLYSSFFLKLPKELFLLLKACLPLTVLPLSLWQCGGVEHSQEGRHLWQPSGRPQRWERHHRDLLRLPRWDVRHCREVRVSGQGFWIHNPLHLLMQITGSFQFGGTCFQSWKHILQFFKYGYLKILCFLLKMFCSSAKFILGSGLFVTDNMLPTVRAPGVFCTIAQIHLLVVSYHLLLI